MTQAQRVKLLKPHTDVCRHPDDRLTQRRLFWQFGRGATGIGTKAFRQRGNRQLAQAGYVIPGKCHGERIAVESFTVALRTGRDRHKARQPFSDRFAAARIALQHDFCGAGVSAGVSRFHACRYRLLALLSVETFVDGHRRLLLGQQYPLPVTLRQSVPRRIDIVAERVKDAAQILVVPAPGPGGDSPLPDAQ